MAFSLARKLLTAGRSALPGHAGPSFPPYRQLCSCSALPHACALQPRSSLGTVSHVAERQSCSIVSIHSQPVTAVGSRASGVPPLVLGHVPSGRPFSTLRNFGRKASKPLVVDPRSSGRVQSARAMSGQVETKTAARADWTNVEGPVVTPEWLGQHLQDVKVLDASWYMPGEKRQPLQEFQNERIAGAQFFDIDAIGDPTSDLPHMLPSAAAFSAAASALGLSPEDPVVVYDGKGIFSAARAWWTFRVFGHEKIWVLQGGLPGYKALNLPLESGSAEKEVERAHAAAEAVRQLYGAGAKEAVPSGSYRAQLQPRLVWAFDQVLANVESREAQIVDARSKGRFDGVDPEPRAGVRGGHIPGSYSVPFPKVLSPEGGLLDVPELKAAFESAGLSLDQPVVASCGTGVTASVLALALHKLGRGDVAVYDGSWTEWGSRDDAPVATTAS